MWDRYEKAPGEDVCGDGRDHGVGEGSSQLSSSEEEEEEGEEAREDSKGVGSSGVAVMVPCQEKETGQTCGDGRENGDSGSPPSVGEGVRTGGATGRGVCGCGGPAALGAVVGIITDTSRRW
jgi:hypothetical protein